jgi:hypothetical protein
MRDNETGRLRAAWQEHAAALAANGFALEIRCDGLEGWWDEIGSRSDSNPSFRPGPDILPENSAWIRLTHGACLAGGIALRMYEWRGLPGPRVFQLGGLVIWPEFRGARAGHHLVQLVRILGFLEFDCEQNIGLELAHMAESAMPLGYYEYARVAPVAHDLELGGARRRLYLTHISRAEYLARLGANGHVKAVRAGHNQAPVGELHPAG